MKPKMKLRDRRDPGLGDVVAVPLGKDRWAYLCSLGGSIRFYPFNFISVKLLKKSPEFTRSNWLRPIGWEDYALPVTYITVGRLSLDRMERLGGMWRLDTCPLRGVETPDGYKLVKTPNGTYEYRDNKGAREITADEARNLPEAIWLDRITIVDYMLKQRLRVLQGKHSAPPIKEKDMVPETVDLEVMVYTDTCDYDPEQLSGEIEDYLKVNGPDEWELIDASDGEIVIRVAKEHASEVTGLMRRVMRKKLTPQQLESVTFARLEEDKEPKELSLAPKPKINRRSNT